MSPPATSAFFRCLYAVPPVVLLAWLERRRLGPMPGKAVAVAWAAGLMFVLDLLFWHHAIEYVGAGLATVLGNLQVFIVVFAAWALFKERPSRRLIGTPVVFAAAPTSYRDGRPTAGCCCSRWGRRCWAGH